MQDDFVRRMRAAARGEELKTAHPVDTGLRALVRQLEGGPPAPTSQDYEIVGGKREKRPKGR